MARNDNLLAGHRGWRNSRKLDPNDAYRGIRFAMLHTLSHLLIRELALECGYSAASIRERIYADTVGDRMFRYKARTRSCSKGLPFLRRVHRHCEPVSPNTSAMSFSAHGETPQA
jgi:hypothetical protein